MTGPDLDATLAAIGWTGRALAARLDCSEMLVRKWRAEAIPIPDPVARWLERVARALERLPAPTGWRQQR